MEKYLPFIDKKLEIINSPPQIICINHYNFDNKNLNVAT